MSENKANTKMTALFLFIVSACWIAALVMVDTNRQLAQIVGVGGAMALLLAAVAYLMD